MISVEDKLLLLHSATSHHYTSKPELFSFLSSKFPHLPVQDIATFFEGVVDFEAVRVWREQQERLQELEEVVINNNLTENEMDDIKTEIKTLSPARPQSAPPSPVPTKPPATAPVPVPTPSPPLVVPVRTPSGRTLRSNSTVNTSEPRRLRSNK